MSAGKLFHNRAPAVSTGSEHRQTAAVAKVRSPTVANCDWWTSSWWVSDDRRCCLDSMSDNRQTSAAKWDGAVPFSDR